ncbi:MAG: M24 family metallopeptidase, partial [Thermoanaerobaculia bacterium]|nr:M24 family metallopeptidase [Thermoanaerobaculia bacterium]
ARPERGSGILRQGDRPLTAGRLRRRIGRELAAHGLEQPEGNIVSGGRHAAVPHSQGDSERPLRAGETIVVDLYPKGRLFADCTRTFCVGAVPAAVETAHRLVREVLVEATERLEPGESGSELQSAACDRFEAAGWSTARGSASAGTGYVHGLGHGVGYELHELPAFRGEEDTHLSVGDVFTVEPGLYDPRAAFGVRLEDLFVMTEAGAECLTPLPYDLDPSLW